MRDEPKPGYGAQLRANLEPTKGVGRLRQQDGGHGSRTAKECVTTHLPNQLAPKWMALKRDLYPPPGKSQASMTVGHGSIDPKSRGNSPDSALCANFKGDPLPTPETAQPEVGSSGWKSTARRVVSVHSRALENRGPKAATPGRTHNRSRSPRIGSRAGLGVPVQPADCWRLLEPLTWRATASCRPGTDWERLFRAFPRRTANSELCSECQSEEIQPSALNHSQGNGLGRISGKEDPVELDSSPTL
ncbi:hypothetical protein Bca101_101692 [Brassica carinata]